MSETSEGRLFRRIHHLRCREQDLAGAIAGLPRQSASLKARLDKARAARSDAGEQIKARQVTHRAKESAIKASTAQIRKLSEQRDGASSQDDFNALEREIAHAKAQIGTCEDEILALLDEIDALTARLPELDSAITRAEGESGEFDRGMPARASELKESLEAVRTELAQRDSEVPSVHQSAYKRMVSGRGPDALAPLDGASCGACGTEQTVSDVSRVRRLVFAACTECARILYLTEKDEKELG